VATAHFAGLAEMNDTTFISVIGVSPDPDKKTTQ
jgi:hypothetical protein